MGTSESALGGSYTHGGAGESLEARLEPFGRRSISLGCATDRIIAGVEIGLLHPGEMGAAIGNRFVAAGHVVRWLPSGRSADSAARAAASGLEASDSLSDLVRRVDAIVSVCPPHGAQSVAHEVAVAGFRGWYVDLNAIAPSTASAIAALVASVGARYVDGGIVGSPPPHERTTIYLSGPDAAGFADALGEVGVRLSVLTGDMVGASALKMAYGTWTKGTAALVLAISALARRHGVADDLDREWERSQPDVPGRVVAAARAALAKGWRWSGEMQEVAASFRALGLPEGFGHAAAAIYAAVERDVPQGGPADLERVLGDLLGGDPLGGDLLGEARPARPGAISSEGRA